MKNIQIDNTLAQTKETQASITPEIALNLLKRGNERFIQNKTLSRDFDRQIAKTANAQYPFSVILSCIDSRIPTEIIFDQGIGDIFNIRIAGNIINKDILASLEFACSIIGVPSIIVLGHTDCGAIKGACDQVQVGNLPYLLDKIVPSIKRINELYPDDQTSKNPSYINEVASLNVKVSCEQILQESSILLEMHLQQQIQIAGAMYDVSTGKVEFLD